MGEKERNYININLYNINILLKIKRLESSFTEIIILITINLISISYYNIYNINIKY